MEPTWGLWKKWQLLRAWIPDLILKCWKALKPSLIRESTTLRLIVIEFFINPISPILISN